MGFGEALEDGGSNFAGFLEGGAWLGSLAYMQ